MGLSVLPGKGDNRETGARPVQSRCRKGQPFSKRNAATGKPGRRRNGAHTEPEYLPTNMFRVTLRATEVRKMVGQESGCFLRVFPYAPACGFFVFWRSCGQIYIQIR